MGRVVLHIGMMKTGTTYLQSGLARNQALLDTRGVRLLGGSLAAQSRAVRQALPARRAAAAARWRKLAEQAVTDDRVSVLSMEFLSFADGRQVQRLLGPLEGAEVDVVVTIRDQFRVLPAQWQTYCRNYGTSDWRRFLREIDPQGPGRDTPAFRKFHRAQDVLAIVDRWQRAPQVSAVKLVVVPDPEAPRTLLWDRFCAASGIPGEQAAPPAKENLSLGFGSCDVLRRTNAWLGDVPRRPYNRGIRPLVGDVLAHRRGVESRPELDRPGAALALARNEELRALVRSGRFAVHGEESELPAPESLGGYPRRARPVPTAEARAAAVAAWQHLRGRAGMAAADPPRRLGPLTKEIADLLRRVNGWT